MLAISQRSGFAAAPANRALACRSRALSSLDGYYGRAVLALRAHDPLSGGALRPRPLASSAASPVPPRGTASSGSSISSAGGGGRGEGRSGPGRGGAPARGRGSQRAFEDSAPDDPAGAETLEQLAALVRTYLPGWRAAGDRRRLSKAMSRAVQLSSDEKAPGQSAQAVTDLCHNIFANIAGAYLPLVPQLRTAADCIIPLYACSEVGYWGPASAGGKGGLAVALLQRLSENDFALLKPRKAGGQTASSRAPLKPSKADQDHANLWRVLAAAPLEVRSCVDVKGLLIASSEAIYCLESIATQACSNILLACARLQLKGFDRLAHRLTARLVVMGQEARSQHLANALYALGELAEDLGHRPRSQDVQNLADAVAGRLTAFSGKGPYAFTPQELANMLLACAKVGTVHPALRPNMEAVAKALAEACIGRRFSGFKAVDFSHSAWALVKLGYTDPRWYAALVAAAAVPGAMQRSVSQDWSNLWYALALARHRPASGRLLELTAQAAGALREDSDTQACANLLWALANLRLYDERLVDALAARLGELLKQDPAELTDQGLCNSLWALAVMGPDVLSRHSSPLNRLLREAVRRWEADGGRAALPPEELRQLWQVQLELEAMGGGELRSILGAGEGRQGSLLSSARAEAVNGVRRLAPLPVPPLEAEVASGLDQLQQRMGSGAIVSVQRRCAVGEVGRFAEAMVELAGGRRVVVETMGLSEVFANEPHRRTLVGPVELYLRQLGRVPSLDKVLCVPYWEWEEAKVGGEAGQRAYLCRLLGLGAT